MTKGNVDYEKVFEKAVNEAINSLDRLSFVIRLSAQAFQKTTNELDAFKEAYQRAKQETKED